jgi:hypothetical protein
VGAAVAEYEAMVKSDDLLDEADLTTQFKNFLRSNRCADMHAALITSKKRMCS